MRAEPARDDDGNVVLSATEAAWLAKTSEQTLRNWMRSSPLFANRPPSRRAAIRFDDLQRLLSDKNAPPALSHEWLSLRPEDPPPSVWRPREAPGHPSTPPGAAPRAGPDLPAVKAAAATASAELAESWQRERETARERDHWEISAKGYRKALRALVTKDGRLDKLSDQP